MDKISFFILNVFINSFLAFFTAVFLIESFILLFRIRQGRVAATLRMVPIVKLPLDLFLYDFSKWSYPRGINPLDCEVGTRALSATLGYVEQIKDSFLFSFNSGIRLTVYDSSKGDDLDVYNCRLDGLFPFSCYFEYPLTPYRLFIGRLPSKKTDFTPQFFDHSRKL